MTHPPMILRHVVVVVPARDEERRIGACLRSVSLAAARLRQVRPGCGCTVVVVLDGCRDATADVVAGFGGVVPVVLDLGVIGSVRAAGVTAGLAVVKERTSGFDPATVWLAHTDADTRVPPHWLDGQVQLAESGAGLVLGTVEPDPEDTAAAVAAAWWSRHRPGEDHRSVHGANLGVRASVYAEVGGFGALGNDEDVDLVHRLEARGVVVARTDRTRVATSGRTRGRTDGGFAAYLADLG